MVDWGLVNHKQDGTHNASFVVASYISASAVTAGTLAASSVLVGNLAASSVVEGNLGFSIITASSTDTLTNKTLTAPKIVSGGFIADSNGNEQIKFTTTASAVNEITVTNAATGGAPILEATGETNVNLVARAKGNGLLKTSVLRQDITSNSYVHNSVVLTGWGYIDTSSVQEGSGSVTFGVTFASAPVVVVGHLSLDDGTPAAISDFVSGPDNEDDLWTLAARNISTTGFVIGYRATSAQAASRYIGYSWVAIGAVT